MRVIYFDCFSGISGDMILGALMSLGIGKKELLNELDKINLKGFEILEKKTSISGIAVTDVEINLSDAQHYERNLEDIEKIINTSGLSQWVKEKSIKAFRLLAEAESSVHNTDIDNIHFHEVGATDAIVDIVGAFICLELLGIRRAYSSSLNDGHGFVSCCHGKLPVPVPAVLEISRKNAIPLRQIDVEAELVTPTGISIIGAIVEEFGQMPEMNIKAVGYGAGKRKTTIPNMLRVVLGDIRESDDKITLVQANIDDMNPEVLGFTMDRLFEKGALDVFFTTIYMKKNRTGVLISVLCNTSDVQIISECLFKETTTTGVRFSQCKRYKMSRELVPIKTKFGEVKVKVCRIGNITKFKPEYEECKKIALESGLPIMQIMFEVERKAKEIIKG